MSKDREEVQRSNYGCGDNSCIFGSPGGMGTNGGCRCLAEMPRHALTDRLRVQRGIMALRDQIKVLHSGHLRAVKLAKIEALEEISDYYGHTTRDMAQAMIEKLRKDLAWPVAEEPKR